MGLTGKMKTGGGQLNDKDVTIVAASFLTGETAKIKTGKNKGKPFTPLSFVLEVQPDGADSTITRKLLIGNADNIEYEIEDDGKVIRFAEGAGMFANCEAAIFLLSCVAPEDGELKFEDDAFGAEDEIVDVTCLDGSRVRLVQPVNADRPKQQDKKDPNKQWDARDLKVKEVYELGGDVKPAKGKASSKVATKGKAAKAEEVEFDAKESATQALLRYLEDAKDQTLAVSKLKTKATTDPEFRALDKSERSEIIELLEDADFLKSVDEIEYNGKKGIVSLPSGD